MILCIAIFRHLFVSHLIRNDGVGGSIPSCGTSLFKGLLRVVKVVIALRSHTGHGKPGRPGLLPRKPPEFINCGL